MTETGPIPVIDGHNDTLTNIHYGRGSAEERSFLMRSEHGHVDLPRAREGGLAGGFFAIFTSSRNYERVTRPLVDDDGNTVPGAWATELPPRLRRREALRFTMSIVSELVRTVEAADGAVDLVRSAADLRRCLEDGTFAVILHIEGAEAIDTRLEALDVFHAAGLRSLGPVWSRPNAFGHGVPFDFPRGPDTGPGLTAAGRELVRRCNRLGVLIDLSHLNERGFRDVARISDAPLVATHSGVHALCPTPRNLTDQQLDTIGASGGVVGIVFNVPFLRADGDPQRVAETSLVEIAKHARHVADRIGVEHVALGSDFDGATMPWDLPDAASLPALLEALRDIGFGASDVRRIAHGNWLRVVEETWGC